MKTRIPIRKYVLDPEVDATIRHLLGPDAGTGRVLENAVAVASEYRRLEEHHQQETKFLISTIESLEQQVDRLLAYEIARTDPFSSR